ncbi:MAG: Hsp20/alpha crystallin family protein [Cyanobacteriota bacterium]|nr:Hsp20/alpha crystallin family protein [Cyanobacteriota bacterium]
MLTLRSSSPFDLFDQLDQQFNRQLNKTERVPAAEIHETPEAYELVLELPGVDKSAIAVKATERSLLISAERSSQRPVPEPTGEGSDAPSRRETVSPRDPLMSEFRYGTWSRSFRFPQAIDRDNIQAVYRDGLLSVSAPKAGAASSVTVKVEG